MIFATTTEVFHKFFFKLASPTLQGFHSLRLNIADHILGIVELSNVKDDIYNVVMAVKVKDDKYNVVMSVKC